MSMWQWGAPKQRRGAVCEELARSKRGSKCTNEGELTCARKFEVYCLLRGSFTASSRFINGSHSYAAKGPLQIVCAQALFCHAELAGIRYVKLP